MRQRNRKAVKADAAAVAIRWEIIEGIRKPGSLLPTRDQLVDQYQTSRKTLQKSIDKLMEEGFIETNGRKGSFVSQTPPHLYQIGLVVYEEVQSRAEYNAIEEAIKIIEENSLYRFKKYAFLADYKPQEEIKKLNEDLENNLLAGLISFYVEPIQYVKYNIFERKDTPMLFLTTDTEILKVDEPVNLNYFVLNYYSLIDKVIENIQNTDLKNVAWIVNPHFSKNELKYLLENCEKNHINTPPYWVQGAEIINYECKWLTHTIDLMMSSNKPEAIVVLDENLLETVIEALQQLKQHIPNDIQIISHCSFPQRSKETLPISKIGFDLHSFFRNGIDLLKKKKQKPEYAEYSFEEIKWEK